MDNPSSNLIRMRSANEKDVTWTCDTCGEVKPRMIKSQSKCEYVRDSCTCQKRKEKEKERIEYLQYQREIREAMQQSNIKRCYTWLGETRPGNWETLTLDTFVHEAEIQLKAYKTAIDFIEIPFNLILWSKGYGVGKTHLATAICNFMLLERGWKCLFASCQDMFRAIEARWDKPNSYEDTYSDIVKRACDCDLLVLDDMSRLVKYRKELDEIIDRRHNQSKQTIITLNAPNVEITESDVTGVSQYIGQAATDRLCDGKIGGLIVCEMSGTSWRRKK